MGWKNVKTHYRIEHLVHVTPAGICIGSPYIHDIIVIDQQGQLVKRYEDRGNAELQRYQREMEADPVQLRLLVAAPDSFTEHIPVFTYDGAEILEKRCEKLGWPNVTHDGQLMYENTFSADKATVIAWAKRNAASGVKMYEQSILEEEAKIQRLREQLARYQEQAAQLAKDYPSSR